jgi:hypothetical protein
MTDYAAYLDDSGHPIDRPFILLAGFISTEAKWLEFDPKWRATLKEHRIEEPFHMTDFERVHRKDPEKWTKLHALIDLILEYTEAHLIVGMDMLAYKKLNAIYPLEEFIGTPVSIIAREVWKHLERWKEAALTPGDSVLLFIEEGTFHRGDLAEVMRRDGLPIPVDVPKKLPFVQPADWLGWEALRALRQSMGRKTLQRVYKQNKISMDRIIDEKDLRYLCTELKLPLRSSLGPGAQIAFHTTPKKKRRRTIK